MTYNVSIEKNGLQTHVGTLTGDRPENTVFAYAPEYLAAEGAAPISLSLPLQEDAHRNALNARRCWLLRKQGVSGQAAAAQLDGQSTA